MFIAMNRFRVARGSEEAFEQVWLNRDSQLNKVPGFVEFHLLKGPEAEDHTLYASHTVWQSKSAFEDWTKSEAFRAAHARAGNNIDRPALSRASEVRRLRGPPDHRARRARGRLTAMTAPSFDLSRYMAENPGAVFETVASEHGVTPRAAVEALPAEMRALAPGEAFIDAMGDIAKWGDVTLIVHTEDGIMEFTGPIPAGQVMRGYFNLMGSTGFHGHLRHDRCAGLAFVERPFMNKLSAVIVFFNRRRRDHVQGLRRPRREARAQGRSACGVPRARRSALQGGSRCGGLTLRATTAHRLTGA